MIPVCPSRMCYFNSGNIEGTNSSEMCVWCLCSVITVENCKVPTPQLKALYVCFVLCLHRAWFCGLT